MSVAVVIEKRTAGVPSFQPGPGAGRNAGLGGHICKGPIAIVAVQRAIAPIGDEEIFMAVVVVVSCADALSPACPCQAGLQCDICERSVPVVLIQPADRLGTLGKRRLEACSIDKE